MTKLTRILVLASALLALELVDVAGAAVTPVPKPPAYTVRYDLSGCAPVKTIALKPHQSALIVNAGKSAVRFYSQDAPVAEWPLKTGGWTHFTVNAPDVVVLKVKRLLAACAGKAATVTLRVR